MSGNGSILDPSVLNDGITSVLGGSYGGLIEYVDHAVRKNHFYMGILEYFNELMGAAIFVWGLFYFLKAFWDMLRGQESWDEFFVFIVKKSLPVIVLFLFVWPINIPPLLTTGEDPFGIYVFKLGEEIAFNLPTRFGIKKEDLEVAPFVMAKDTFLYKKAEAYMKQKNAQLKNDSPKESKVMGTKDVWKGIKGLFNKVTAVPEKVKAAYGVIKDPNKWFKEIGLDGLMFLLSVFFKVGFFVAIVALFMVYVVQLVLIKLKFIFFIPLFYLSTIFLLFDRYRDIFYDNLKALFSWMLQPTFLILAVYVSIEVCLFIMMLFVTDDSPIVRIFTDVLSFEGAGFVKGIAIFIANLVLLGFFLKMAVTLPSRVTEGVFSGLSRIVSTAFRSIE